MAFLTIHSGLRHFKLVERITRVSASGICGEVDFDCMPVYGALESLAQLAALHARHTLDFTRHAFLLKVNCGRWPAQGDLTGCFKLSADLASQSSNAFAYRTKAQGPVDTALISDLFIGTIQYDGEFQEDILKTHYRKVFRKLQMDRQ